MKSSETSECITDVMYCTFGKLRLNPQGTPTPRATSFAYVKVRSLLPQDTTLEQYKQYIATFMYCLKGEKISNDAPMNPQIEIAIC
jgi:hypothetical protein